MKLRFLIICLIVCAVGWSGLSARQLAAQRIGTMDVEAEGEQIFLPFVASASGAVNAQIEPEAVPGEYLVLWKTPTRQALHAAQVDPTIVLAGEDMLGAMRSSGSTTPRIDLVRSNNLDELGSMATVMNDILEDYRNNPDVLAVEPNYIYRALGTVSDLNNKVPNDPDVDRQWGIGISRLPEAWEITEGSAETVIAIIDSGVALDHPDLVNKLEAGYDFVENDALPNDEYGHGTHVAGIAGAQTGNGIGIAGACPNCRILPLRALNAGGGGSAANVVKAIYHAIDAKVDVINLSLGAPSLNSDILQRAVDDAWEAGIFVTCAAGNTGHIDNSLIYPAAFDTCVAVGATTQDDVLADEFSQYGTWIELAAPGQAIYSTFTRPTLYVFEDGTSMAAPHVAGLAGLLAGRGLSNNQIRNQLCDSADQIAGTGANWACGRINALAALTNEVSPDVTPTPTPTNPFWPDGGTATATPTPTPTATPPASIDLLPNGGFEEGTAAWFFSDLGIVTQKTSYNGESRSSAELGGENNSTDQIFQDVLVPNNGELRYNWGALGDDTKDVLRLEIEMLDGSDAQILIDLTDSYGHWRTRSLNLNALAGKMIRIRFRAVTDGDDPSVFYVDNVGVAGDW